MSNLSMFFAGNAVQEENLKFVVSKRFVDNGEPVEWELMCIDSVEEESLRKDCIKRVQAPGKRGQYIQETDVTLYMSRLAVRCTVFPNLNDVELQNSYGVMGAEALLKKMLKPGEYAEYLARVQEVNGFDQSMEEEVEEAKN